MKGNRLQVADDEKPIKAEGKKSYGLTILWFCGFVILLCCTCIFAAAQNTVFFGYDASGNRISRTIIMQVPSAPPRDSTENAAEEQEDIIAAVQDAEDGYEMPQEIYTDALSETLITIYPNPARGLLTVRMSGMSQQSASSLTLFDMQGRAVARQQPLSDENRLDISAQPAGTYIMQITAGTEVTSWKIVKQ